MRGWIDLGSDVDWISYFGKWGKPVDSERRIWYVVEFTNMYDAVGEDECKRNDVNQYEVQIKRVDLKGLTPEKLRSVLDCCGLDLNEVKPEYRNDRLVAACVDYGYAAPMWEKSSPSYAKRLLANARCEAERLMKDAVAERALLDRPVNMIGTSAENYGLGKIFTNE